MPFLEMVTADQFRAMRDCLAGAKFTEAVLRQWLELKPAKDLDLVALSSRPPLKRELESALDAIIRVFVLGEALPSAEVQQLFSPEVWAAFHGTRLLLGDSSDSNRVVASVALYPVRDLFIASDRWVNPDHSARPRFPDIVFPALTKTGKQFLDFTSFEPCEDFLEVCAGTAPAALLAARSARNIWATDIAERSIEFAKFNAALNGIHNVAFVKGDLFEPVDGHMFDRIAAHPPYVPVLEPAEIFYGGGESGEEITKRIISELPARLKVGGRLYCRTLGTERPGETFDARLRNWLGERNGEFDVALFPLQEFEPRQFALEETINRDGGRTQYRQWEKLFSKQNVHELVVGIVIIERIARPRPAFTIRRTIRPNTPLEAIEALLRWEASLAEPGAEELLPRVRPVAVEGTEIVARHVLKEREIVPSRFTLSTELPFAMDCKAQPWMAFLLPLCNGKNTIADLFELAKRNGWIEAETPQNEFSRLLAALISGGLLQTEALRLPAVAG